MRLASFGRILPLENSIVTTPKNPHAVALGRRGGSKNTKAQIAAHKKSAKIMGSGNRRYSKCPKAPPSRPDRHSFDHAGVCWYCKKSRGDIQIREM
jgi:hypothetical protein